MQVDDLGLPNIIKAKAFIGFLVSRCERISPKTFNSMVNEEVVRKVLEYYGYYEHLSNLNKIDKLLNDEF